MSQLREIRSLSLLQRLGMRRKFNEVCFARAITHPRDNLTLESTTNLEFDDGVKKKKKKQKHVESCRRIEFLFH